MSRERLCLGGRELVVDLVVDERCVRDPFVSVAFRTVDNLLLFGEDYIY